MLFYSSLIQIISFCFNSQSISFLILEPHKEKRSKSSYTADHALESHYYQDIERSKFWKDIFYILLNFHINFFKQALLLVLLTPQKTLNVAKVIQLINQRKKEYLKHYGNVRNIFHWISKYIKHYY